MNEEAIISFDWKKQLEKGENLLWDGEPVTTSGVIGENIRSLVFGLIYFFLIMVVMMIIKKSSELTFTVGIIFAVLVIAGIYMVVNSIIAIINGNSSVYAVTNKRIMSFNRRNGRLSVITYGDFNKVYSKETKNGCGSIRFVNYASDEQGSDFAEKNVYIDNIRELAEVVALIEENKKLYDSQVREEQRAIAISGETPVVYDDDVDMEILREACKQLRGEKLVWVGRANSGQSIGILIFREVAGFLVAAAGIGYFINAMAKVTVTSPLKLMAFVVPVVIAMSFIIVEPIVNIARKSRLEKTLYLLTKKYAVTYFSGKITKHEISSDSRAKLIGSTIEISGGGVKNSRQRFVNIASPAFVKEMFDNIRRDISSEI